MAAYIEAVGREGTRLEQALAAAVATAGEEARGAGYTEALALADVAWLVAVQANLRSCGEPDPSALNARVTAFDRGLFWSGSYGRPRALGADVGGYFVEVVARRGGGSRAVVIKAGSDGADDVIPDLFDLAQRVGPPPDGAWLRGPRRVSGDTVGCWRADANHMTPAEAAVAALAATRWIADMCT